MQKIIVLTLVVLIASQLLAGEAGPGVQEPGTPAPAGGTGDSVESGVRDCGPQCVRYLSRYYNRPVDLERARKLCEFTEESTSTSMLNLKRACERIGLHCFGLTGPLTVMQKAPFSDCSFIVLTKRDEYSHFVVVVKGKAVNERFWVDPSVQKGRQLLPSEFSSDARHVLLAVRDSPIQTVAGVSQQKSSISYRLLTPAVGALIIVFLVTAGRQRFARRNCGARS